MWDLAGSLITIVVPTLVILWSMGLFYFDRLNMSKHVARWRSVAERLGLGDLATELRSLHPGLTARVGRHRVRFERHRDAADPSLAFTRVTVEGNSGITLRPEGSTAELSERVGEREIELGDDAFDAEVNVHGDSERVRAILDAETRGIVRRMLASRIEVPGRPPVTIPGPIVLVHGHLRADFLERPGSLLIEELAEGVAALLALAERFQRPVDVAKRLATSIRHEPHWRVRLYGLEVLSANHPKYPATMAALRHALADEVAEVRLQAAIGLGEEGRPALLEIALGGEGQGSLAGITGCRAVEDATVAHAIDALGDSFPVDACGPVLLRALRARRVHTADACIRALGRGGGSAAVELLAKVLSRETGPLAVAAAQALGKCHAGAAEAALLDALDGDVPDLRVPAIEALGHTGSARAVPAIKEAAEAADAGAEVRRAARQAVAEIQSRLPGASPGQLSLAEGEAGRLSLAADDPRGRVSLPEGG